MSLEQHVHDIIDMMNQGENVNVDDYYKAKEHYRKELKIYPSATNLKKIVEKHLFELPVDLILETSRRFVEIERSAENLRFLANYLYLHGPDWDKEADALRREADKLDPSPDNNSGA